MLNKISFTGEILRDPRKIADGLNYNPNEVTNSYGGVGENYEIPNIQRRKIQNHTPQDTFQKAPVCDCIQYSPMTSDSQQVQENAKYFLNLNPKTCAKIGALLLSFATVFYAGTRCGDETVVYDYTDFSAQQVADVKDIDVKALILANDGLSSAEDKVNGDIVVPHEVKNFLEEEISELNEKLGKEDISDEKKEKLTKKLDELQARKETAEEICNIYYANGEYYIIPKNANVQTGDIRESLGITPNYISNKYDSYYTWDKISKCPVYTDGGGDTHYMVDTIPLPYRGIVVDENYFNQD